MSVDEAVKVKENVSFDSFILSLVVDIETVLDVSPFANEIVLLIAV